MVWLVFNRFHIEEGTKKGHQCAGKRVRSVYVKRHFEKIL